MIKCSTEHIKKNLVPFHTDLNEQQVKRGDWIVFPIENNLKMGLVTRLTNQNIIVVYIEYYVYWQSEPNKFYSQNRVKPNNAMKIKRDLIKSQFLDENMKELENLITLDRKFEIL